MEIRRPYRKPQVIVADDNERILHAVTRLLAPRFDLVGICRDGKSAIESVLELFPDVLVLDIVMPVLDGIQVARRLRDLKVPIKIVMLAGLNDQEYIDAALEAGVKGFVFKRKMSTDLMDAIDTVLAGRIFLSSDNGEQRLIQ